MQKRSHKLLAKTLMDSYDGFQKKRFEMAFVFGSFQPDCNPLSYLKGSIRAKTLMGHNFSNSQRYIASRITKLERREHWTVWQYYTLGKLTHYLADAFTFPHNDTYTESLVAHRQYEDALRQQFAEYLEARELYRSKVLTDLNEFIQRLHEQYEETVSDWQRDARYILEANWMLLSTLLPMESVMA